MMAFRKDDLTGAALVGLMRLSFAEQGIDLPADAPKPARNVPHASLASKTALAERVLERHGAAALLRVGQSVPRMAFDPIGAALLAARDGPDLIDRWTRLERYVHNRHPIEVREITTTSALLAHFGNPADPPSPAIDLVLAGVFTGLLAAIGCGQVCLRMGLVEIEVIANGQVIAERPPLPSPTGIWRLNWEAGAKAMAKPIPPLIEQQGQPLARTSRQVISIVEEDLFAIPTVASLAARLGLSARTLQRRLSEDDLSIQTIRRAAQIRKASRMLIEGRASLSAIGFACGFSDAAHFTRAYARATGMSPKAFRQAATQA